MERNSFRLSGRYKNLIFQIFLLSLFGSIPVGFCSTFKVAELNETPEERELMNTLPGENKNNGILDATNPLDLINRLRRATAMDNATNPSDAIDDALRAFETDDINDSLIDSGIEIK